MRKTCSHKEKNWLNCGSSEEHCEFSLLWKDSVAENGCCCIQVYLSWQRDKTSSAILEGPPWQINLNATATVSLSLSQPSFCCWPHKSLCVLKLVSFTELKKSFFCFNFQVGFFFLSEFQTLSTYTTKKFIYVSMYVKILNQPFIYHASSLYKLSQKQWGIYSHNTLI